MKLKNIIQLTTLGASVSLFVSCKDSATSDNTDAAQPATTSVEATKLTPATPTNTDAQAESVPVYIVTVSGKG